MRSKIKTIFFAVLFIALCGAVGYFFWSGAFSKQVHFVTVGFKENKVNSTENSSKVYVNEDYGFSFEIPTKYTMSTGVKDIDGISYLGNNKDTGKSFQINVREVNEDYYSIKQEDVIAANNGVEIIDVQRKNIAEGVDALVFTAKNGAVETSEVWFVGEGLLVQISALKEHNDIVNSILETWKM